MSRWFRAHMLQFGLAGMTLGVLLLLAVILLSTPGYAAAAPHQQGEAPSDDECLACHQQEGMTAEIGGQPLPLTVNPADFEASVHGTENVACVDCHTNITGFPHPEVTASSPRDLSLELYPTCQQCHAEQYEKVLDSVHQQALAGGNTNAAVCADCHNPHTQTRLTDKDTGELLPDARLAVPETCAKCHNSIYETYKQSVHGAALSAGDTNVPTCLDCHGVHDIQDPGSNSFRNSTPYLCANCHADEALMEPYGISTNVLSTYVSDFHGTTVKMFEESYPDQPTNKPVCTDCHGVHDIIRPDDPVAGIIYKNNLLVKCQQCHPDATTETFTNAWMRHYEPSPYVFPLVYFVNLFYKIFIPLVLGGMGLYVLTDIYRRFIARPRPEQVEGETRE
ncbi:MAG TPA: ammonia-forming cytochrome c nitrite reductase subunit c552 [Anaerolineales bacterium]|nr:ammonia-forming cytochrome c nitrite reductase subunit c552 [Anaerolineales bacterium]